MAIKNFKKFNESVEMTDQDKEDLKWYLDNKYVIDDRFKTPEELLEYVKINISDAFSKMAARNKIPIKNAKITVVDRVGQHGTKYYINLESDPLIDFGVFKKSIKTANFSFFSGKELEFVTKNNHFLFKPVIFTSLNISYQAIKGGSNGLEYIFNEGTDFAGNYLWYNILLNLFETEKEAMIRKKPMLGSEKMKNLQNKTGIFSEDEEFTSYIAPAPAVALS